MLGYVAMHQQIGEKEDCKRGNLDVKNGLYYFVKCIMRKEIHLTCLSELQDANRTFSDTLHGT